MLRLAISVSLLLAGGCERNGVLLWRAQSRGATIYLLGTVATREGEPARFDPRIEAAFRASDELVLESRVDPGASIEFQDRVLKVVHFPSGDTLHAHISPELEQKLAKVAERAGGSIDGLQPYRPWFIAIVIGNEEKKRLGYPISRPIDRHFADAAAMPVSYLLSPEDVVPMLTGLSEEANADCLAETLEATSGYDSDLSDAYRAWRRGDERAFVEAKRKQMAKHPRCARELREARVPILTRKLLHLFEEPKITFAVVNAMTLVEDDGILATLRGHGIAIEKL
jgi:uncharacterized protein YbaP (TraB family)